MIPPEHAALADAIRSESEADFDQSVEIAADLMRHLRQAGFEIKRVQPTDTQPQGD